MRNISTALAFSIAACATPNAGGPAAAAAADVPFDLATGRPMVDVVINGEGPFPFVFDTGAPGLVILSPLADELSLEVTGEIFVGSPAGGEPVPAEETHIDEIAIGDARVSNVTATILDFGGGAGANLGYGIIGPSVFRDYSRVTMDFTNDTLIIGGDFDVDDERSWMALGDSAPLLDIPLSIGDVDMIAHLDTGAPHILSIPIVYENRLPLSGAVTTVGMARTVDREFEIRGAPIDVQVIAGGATIPLTQIQFFDVPVANLGTGALNGTRLDIDWARDRFALTGTAVPTAGEPRQRMVRTQEPAGDGPRFGVQAAPPESDGAMPVFGTESGSRAEAIGLRAGDRITAINGVSPGELGMAGISPALSVEELVLTVLRGGAEITLTD